MDGTSNSDTGYIISPMKQHLIKRNSLFGDELLNFDPAELEDDDWRDVFDEPGATMPPAAGEDGATSSSSTDNTTDPSHALMPPPVTKDISTADAVSSSASSTGGLPNAAISLSLEGASKLTSSSDPGKIKGGGADEDNGKENSSTSSSEWQSPATDKPLREKMVLDIAQLLYARKKQKNPDDKCVARIKAQARAFETQLYMNAPSLENYNDRNSLKRRIAKLADAFASYFKQAKRRSSLRSSVTSLSSLSSIGSLDGNMANVSLRRSSVDSLPSVLERGIRREQSVPIPSSNPTMPGPLMNNLTRRQSDSGIPDPNFCRGSSGVGPSVVASMVANANTMGSDSNMRRGFAQQHNNQLAGMSGQMSMNPQQQQQQQLLASLQQQQQQVLARQMNMGGQQVGGNNPMLAAQAAMMGNNGMGNNGMNMLNQMQHQQANTMNLSMMQQQHSLLQQQQQQNAVGLNMIQQHQSANAAMMMGATGGGNNNMNMMNMQMQNVISGVGHGGVGTMQNMNLGNNPMMGSRESMTMPPPGMLNAGVTMQRSPGSNDDANQLSPGSFNW